MPKVTLTFDNGPEPEVTPGVLDCLRARNVKATFFLMGAKILRPECRVLGARAAEEGHWIGNHTFTHSRPLGELDATAAVREFEQAEEALRWLQQRRRLFRPFGGGGLLGTHLLHPAVVEKLHAGRYSCVLWNSVPGDWRDADGWLERALADCRTRDWTVLVLHDISAAAMAHLDRFIGRLGDEGFEFVQDFAPECVPIAKGRIVLPIEPYLTLTPARK